MPTYNAQAGNVHIFKHLLPSELESLKKRYKEVGGNNLDKFVRKYTLINDLSPAEVGSASAAAPTFFKPKYIEQLKDDDVEGGYFIDGGVWANSPVLPAIAEAVGTLGIKLDQIRILSIGTRFKKLKIGRCKRNFGGYIPWNLGTLYILMNAQAAGSIGTARWMLGDKQFLRIDDEYEEGKDPTDKKLSFGDIRTVDHLEERANKKVEKMQLEIKEFFKD